MIYSEKHNVCVYNTADPERVVAVIPSAKVIKPDTVAVPCGLWEMQTLGKLGYEVTSPILRDYPWPSKYPAPFDHQRHVASFLTTHPKAFNLCDMGTGKTLATLWAADYLMRQGLIKKALVLSPLSTLSSVWGDEIFGSFLGNRTYRVLHGSRDKRLEALADDVDFYIINHDGLAVGKKREGSRLVLGDLADQIKKRDDIGLIIVDEASAYKESSTQRYKILKMTVKDKPYLWLLTGTPTPGNPTDAYALARLVRDDFTESFTSFKDRVMHKVTTFKWVPRSDAPKTVASLLQPAIRYHRDDCIDLPPCTIVKRDVELTAPQKKAYKEMKDTLGAVLASGVINAVNEAVLRIKLLQISLGAVYDTEKKSHHVDCSSRLKVLEELIEQTEEKVIVFAPFTTIVDKVYEELKKRYDVEKINGSVSQNKRTEIFRNFQNTSSPRIIVADPGTMSHGLTLTAANTIVWYGPTDKPEVYTQANARINRAGQKNHTLIAQLSATDAERETFRRLDAKENMQGLVLQLIKTGDHND